MRTPADSLREEIQRAAAELAARKSVPSARHAQAIVEQIIRERGGELPPLQTVTSLAQELVRAILRAA